ncbi:MAG: replicative DNA helicase [Candidatus Yanofskybacteria bacterium CG10_big_fil_rev_8_21_14_0_10_46_23]|uniref:Replicative DNA helicase n=1 Tax=Candidatus Yanofskybacteria bacterium CG10_big_fil_rev_8_21_14_0_10_46_23 TaxID=1975098 RepID=A0A2H0R3N3_9BACT|nr:MAG: replicative DNA helicase [Candidatus Yanofskybacteria bacterium CG10_big_fil_rev_8_21_14_0_10_46_23]
MNQLPNTLPPQNIEAEQSVLGSLILDNASINKVADIVHAQDFYHRANQIVYQAILDLYLKSEPVDILSLSNKLREANQLDVVGGVGYLTSLVNSVPTSAHVASYAKIVSRKKTLRDLIDAAHTITQLGYNEKDELEELLDEAEQKLFAVSQRSIQVDFTHIGGKALEEAFERIDSLHKDDGHIRGFSSGFVDLDNYLAGFQRSDLIILAARPSIGKTSLAMDFARNVAKIYNKEVPIGIFSLEMSRDQVIDRVLAAEAGISLWKMRTGKLSHSEDSNDFEKIQAALGRIRGLPIYIDDTPSPTVLQMRAMARRLQAQHGLGLLIIDYLQLINPGKNIQNEVQQITEISRGLKGLARELNIPVIALSQMSRQAEFRTDQRPKLSDLRSSGSLEQDADVVMFIYREDRVKKDSEKNNIAEIMIEKHRNGPTGKIELYFDDQSSSFKSLAKNI